MSSSLSVRTRFEVFKRDRFTCSYCGKTPPDVRLEADHIIPRAAGGSDDISNLTTACDECNRGKSDRLLEEGTAPTISRATVEDLRERLEQAAAYAELVGQQSALIEKQVSLINELWAKAFGATVQERKDGEYWVFGQRGDFPNERSVRLFIRRLPIHEVIAAVDITASRHQDPTEWACRLFYKICWRRIKGESGPIDGPGPVAPPEPEPRWQQLHSDATTELEDARAELEYLQGRNEDLEDEVRDLREIIRTYREHRTGGPTRIGDT